MAGYPASCRTWQFTSTINAQRNRVLAEAHRKNPKRWTYGQMQWKEFPVVYLNPDAAKYESFMRKSA